MHQSKRINKDRERMIVYMLCTSFKTLDIIHSELLDIYYVKICKCLCCNKDVIVLFFNNTNTLYWGCHGKENENECKLLTSDDYSCMDKPECPLNTDTYRQIRARFAESLLIMFHNLYKEFGKARIGSLDEEEEVFTAVNYYANYLRSKDSIMYSELSSHVNDLIVTIERGSIINRTRLYTRYIMTRMKIKVNKRIKIRSTLHKIYQHVATFLKPHIEKFKILHTNFCPIIENKFDLRHMIGNQGKEYLKITKKSIRVRRDDCQQFIKNYIDEKEKEENIKSML